MSKFILHFKHLFHFAALYRVEFVGNCEYVYGAFDQKYVYDEEEIYFWKLHIGIWMDGFSKDDMTKC